VKHGHTHCFLGGLLGRVGAVRFVSALIALLVVTEARASNIIFTGVGSCTGWAADYTRPDGTYGGVGGGTVPYGIGPGTSFGFGLGNTPDKWPVTIGVYLNGNKVSDVALSYGTDTTFALVCPGSVPDMTQLSNSCVTARIVVLAGQLTNDVSLWVQVSGEPMLPVGSIGSGQLFDFYLDGRKGGGFVNLFSGSGSTFNAIGSCNPSWVPCGQVAPKSCVFAIADFAGLGTVGSGTNVSGPGGLTYGVTGPRGGGGGTATSGTGGGGQGSGSIPTNGASTNFAVYTNVSGYQAAATNTLTVGTFQQGISDLIGGLGNATGLAGSNQLDAIASGESNIVKAVWTNTITTSSTLTNLLSLGVATNGTTNWRSTAELLYGVEGGVGLVNDALRTVHVKTDFRTGEKTTNAETSSSLLGGVYNLLNGEGFKDGPLTNGILSMQGAMEGTNVAISNALSTGLGSMLSGVPTATPTVTPGAPGNSAWDIPFQMGGVTIWTFNMDPRGFQIWSQIAHFGRSIITLSMAVALILWMVKDIRRIEMEFFKIPQITSSGQSIAGFNLNQLTGLTNAGLITLAIFGGTVGLIAVGGVMVSSTYGPFLAGFSLPTGAAVGETGIGMYDVFWTILTEIFPVDFVLLEATAMFAYYIGSGAVYAKVAFACKGALFLVPFGALLFWPATSGAWTVTMSVHDQAYLWQRGQYELRLNGGAYSTNFQSVNVAAGDTYTVIEGSSGGGSNQTWAFYDLGRSVQVGSLHVDDYDGVSNLVINVTGNAVLAGDDTTQAFWKGFNLMGGAGIFAMAVRLLRSAKRMDVDPAG